MSEKFSGKVIRCRNCSLHLNVPATESEPGVSANQSIPDTRSTAKAPSHPQPSAQAGWADLSLPDESGHGAPVNTPPAYPTNSGAVNTPHPQTLPADFLPVDTAPPQMTFPPYSAPQGAAGYPYGGGPIGPRPKTIDLAAERRKKLKMVTLGVQLVY